MQAITLGRLGLKATAASSHFEHWEDGFRFDIHVSLDDEFGWGGNLTVGTFGRQTPELAVADLRQAAAMFLKMTEPPIPSPSSSTEEKR